MLPKRIPITDELSCAHLNRARIARIRSGSTRRAAFSGIASVSIRAAVFVLASTSAVASAPAGTTGTTRPAGADWRNGNNRYDIGGGRHVDSNGKSIDTVSSSTAISSGTALAAIAATAAIGALAPAITPAAAIAALLPVPARPTDPARASGTGLAVDDKLSGRILESCDGDGRRQGRKALRAYAAHIPIVANESD